MKVASTSILTTAAIPPIPSDKAGSPRKRARAANPISAVRPATNSPAPDRPLHRLRQARRQEGLTRCAVAQRLGKSIGEVQKQEEPSSDLSLSDLYRWQRALGVAAAELLEEPNDELSRSVQLRARLLRAMKTVRSIQEEARQESVQRLACGLADQLIAVMPELKETAPWPTIGRRRLHDELGQAFFRRFARDHRDELEG